tara:strand:+ start:68 stop:562 length:495 start_codon:yes stop_codon:yes gene_type:complete
MNKKKLILLKNKCKNKNYKISLAESCTGGLLSSYITSLKGSSNFFNGSVISYSNDLKKSLLYVNKNTLKLYGAVSRQTALEMAKGLQRRTGSEILVSITGVAGPDGGSKATPIGCVFFGIGIKNKSKYKYKTFKKIFKETSRNKIQIASSEYAINLILKEIKSS